MGLCVEEQATYDTFPCHVTSDARMKLLSLKLTFREEDRGTSKRQKMDPTIETCCNISDFINGR